MNVAVKAVRRAEQKPQLDYENGLQGLRSSHLSSNTLFDLVIHF